MIDYTKFDTYQEMYVKKALETLPEEQVSFFAKIEFDSDVMMSVYSELERGTSFEKISKYITPKMDDIQARIIIEGINEGLSGSQLALLADENASSGAMSQALEGIKKGLSVEDVKILLTHSGSEEFIRQIRFGMQKGKKAEEKAALEEEMATSKKAYKIGTWEGKIAIRSPYNADFIAGAKKIGGRFNSEFKFWYFAADAKSDAVALAEKIYG